jgi:hypothetical protein
VRLGREDGAQRAGDRFAGHFQGPARQLTSQAIWKGDPLLRACGCHGFPNRFRAFVGVIRASSLADALEHSVVETKKGLWYRFVERVSLVCRARARWLRLSISRLDPDRAAVGEFAVPAHRGHGDRCVDVGDRWRFEDDHI